MALCANTEPAKWNSLIYDDNQTEAMYIQSNIPTLMSEDFRSFDICLYCFRKNEGNIDNIFLPGHGKYFAITTE